VPDSEHITTLLLDWRNGNPSAGEELLGVIYKDLRRLAARYLRQERSDHTLQPTALVHELYLRVFTSGEHITWQNRAHFFAVAAQTLRRILVDHARMRQTTKRGGHQVRLSLTEANGLAEPRADNLIEIDEALQRLTELEPRAAQVVELRFFGGLQVEEVAEVLGVSVITVKRDWKVARAWLTAQLTTSDRPQT
jgi:RNA polymerase sigma-70 factor, ECF subfamily